jgi:hypothetical protein
VAFSLAGPQEADGYAYLLVRYLRFKRLDAVLAAMRLLASGGTGAAPVADEKLQPAASQLDLAAFVEWGRRVEQPEQKVGAQTLTPTSIVLAPVGQVCRRHHPLTAGVKRW